MSPRYAQPAFNPYAPPREANYAAPSGGAASVSLEELEEARKSLRTHLADPARAADDLRAAEPRWRLEAGYRLGLMAVAVALFPASNFLATTSDGHDALCGFACLVLLLVVPRGLLRLGRELSIPGRASCTTPVRALRGYLRGLRWRPGYAFSCLSPYARTRFVASPGLGALGGGGQTFPLVSEEMVSASASTFCVHPFRMTLWREIRVLEQQGDFARVEAKLTFGRALVMKSFTTTTRKTLLQGSNGLWYVVDGSVIDA